MKAKIVLEMLQETRPVTGEYGIAPRLLPRRRKELLDHLPEVFADPAAAAHTAHAQEAKLEELYAQIGKLTTQLAWLKKIWPRP